MQAVQTSADGTRDPLQRLRLAGLIVLAMIAFAANSILCRLALGGTKIDPASFTLVRLLSGAAILWAIVRVRRGVHPRAGDWRAALSLFAYASAFSYAYVTLSAGTGALLLFGAVQATMILAALWRGERLTRMQTVGLVLALGGLVALVLPGVTAPPWSGAMLMVGAGIAWGIYSLRGRGNVRPIETTAGNFLRAAVAAVALSLLTLPWLHWEPRGALYAALSGAVASALGYAIWYAALPSLRAAQAATVQLSVPVLAAAGGVVLLGEFVTTRFLLSSAAILGGIALVLNARRRRA
ncbi:MAG TPA: DMT family transporter [Steroidobacteraceae bacterium]